MASARARALTAIATGEARVIVASAPALLPRLVPPSMLASATVELRSGVEIDPQLLAEQLLEAGYTREDPVDEHGEFCIRGGIVDLFPPGDAEPIRVEFIGDTVESMRRYDPSTQRSTGTIDQARDRPDSRTARRRGSTGVARRCASTHPSSTTSPFGDRRRS